MAIANRLYEWAGVENQARIDRLRFGLGLLPRIHTPLSDDNVTAHFPPAPYKTCLIVSADLELAWAWRYARGIPAPVDYAIRQAEDTRRNFGSLLELFDRYQIPVTWAVVGHLFLERCACVNHQAHPELNRLAYFENELWRYRQGDWFDEDPCTDVHRDPAWYAPDLINAILGARVKHEIACHSFSHIDFSDNVCTAQVADSELEKCKAIARDWGLELNSLVFPGNLVGNLASLSKHGIAAYRIRTGYELDVPRRDAFGMWQIPGELQWEKRPGWTVNAWVKALERCLDRALDTGTVFHLWFHPSCERVNVEQVFPQVLEYIDRRRSDIWITTMTGLANGLAS